MLEVFVVAVDQGILHTNHYLHYDNEVFYYRGILYQLLYITLLNYFAIVKFLQCNEQTNEHLCESYLKEKASFDHACIQVVPVVCK